MERSLLSDLPDDIIHHIVSLLTNPEAIRLSLVSKHLFDMVQMRPNLVLRYHHSILPPWWWRHDPKYAERYGEEVSYIVRTLDRYHTDNIPLESFTLRSDWRSRWSRSYKEGIHDRCIELAATKGPRKLLLDMHRKRDNSNYVLPQPVFEAESLVELEAYYCCLNPERAVAWSNLKRLRLLHVSAGPVSDEEASECTTSDEEASEYLNSDQEVFECITRGCPSLENLEVDCRGFPTLRFNVANLRNLKVLDMELRTGQRLEVNARTTPNLESIVCRSGEGHFDLGDAEYPNLTTLQLHCEGIGDHFFTTFASKFPVLEKLSLDAKSLVCNQTSQPINLSSTSLKEIDLEVRTVTFLEACFDLPNLVRFFYFQWKYEIVPKLSFAGNSGGWSSEISLFEDKRNLGAPWFLELNKFLAALNGSETTIELCFGGGEEKVLFDEDHRTIANSVMPVQGIREFSLVDVNWLGFSSSGANAILDCIFLICQPQTITFMRYCMACEFPKLLYEKLISTSSVDRHGVIDFEMSHGSERSQSSGRFKEWDKLLEGLEADENKSISFHLEYCSQN